MTSALFVSVLAVSMLVNATRRAKRVQHFRVTRAAHQVDVWHRSTGA